MNSTKNKKESSLELCELCNINSKLYSCPRCNVQYCSLNCYKSSSHSQCSEQFYEDCVQDELAAMEGDNEEKAKMANILRKMQREAETADDDVSDDENEDPEELDSDDDDDSAELENRFSGINLDDGDEVWNALTEEERTQFVQMISGGNILSVIPVWNPWWASGGDNKPDLASNVPLLSQLMSGALSPHLSAIVLNTLGAYLITSRFLKGEVHGFCVEAITAIWKLSRTLRCGAEVASNCTTFDKALALLQEDLSQCSWITTKNFKFDFELLEKDINTLKEHGSEYILRALSDILAICNEAATTLKSSKSMERFTGEPPKISEIKRAIKKITFYLAWAKEADPRVWDCVDFVENISDDE